VIEFPRRNITAAYRRLAQRSYQARTGKRSLMRTNARASHIGYEESAEIATAATGSRSRGFVECARDLFACRQAIHWHALL
jgi:fumarate hydratase class II